MPSSSSSSQQQPSRAELSAALDGVEQAGPIASMPTWDAAELAQLPASVQPLFMDPNLRTGSDFETPNKPPNMRSDVSVQLSLTPPPALRMLLLGAGAGGATGTGDQPEAVGGRSSAPVSVWMRGDAARRCWGAHQRGGGAVFGTREQA